MQNQVGLSNIARKHQEASISFLLLYPKKVALVAESA